MKVSAHEDNSSALILASTLTPKFTTCSNYCATKIIWFCKDIYKINIVLLNIATVEQLGDLFNMGLSRATLE